MLRDLRELYLNASGVSTDWEMLAQAGQGARKIELLELAERCRPDTLRVARWANGKLRLVCRERVALPGEGLGPSGCQACIASTNVDASQRAGGPAVRKADPLTRRGTPADARPL